MGESLRFFKKSIRFEQKELDIGISVGNDFYFYVKEILSNVVDDQYDLLIRRQNFYLTILIHFGKHNVQHP